MSIQKLREQTLQEWREHDPHLVDVDGYREFFNERFHQRQVKEKKEVEEKIENLVSELFRPIIIWPGPWAEDAPEWLKGQIKIDRLAQLMKGVEGLATYSEVVFYMLPLTQESPLSHNWHQIYFYCCKQVIGHKVPKSEKWLHDVQLTKDQERQLRDLRRWIWKKSREALKKRR